MPQSMGPNRHPGAAANGQHRGYQNAPGAARVDAAAERQYHGAAQRRPGVQHPTQPHPKAHPSAQPRAHVPEEARISKTLSDPMAALVPEAALFRKLVAYEKEIEGVLQKQQQEIRRLEQSRTPHPRMVRVCIWNSQKHQPPPAPAGAARSPGDTDADADAVAPEPGSPPPQWTLHVTARALNEDDFYATERQLSDIFDKVELRLPEGFPERVLQWVAADGPCTSVEFSHAGAHGAREAEVEVALHCRHFPPRFRLASDPLASALGVQIDSRAGLLHALWTYLKVRCGATLPACL